MTVMMNFGKILMDFRTTIIMAVITPVSEIIATIKGGKK